LVIFPLPVPLSGIYFLSKPINNFLLSKAGKLVPEEEFFLREKYLMHRFSNAAA